MLQQTSTPIPVSDDNSLPQVEFDVRTGAPKQGVKSSNKIIEVSDVKTAKGQWLRTKLAGLENDPKFKSATPEQQKEWKSLAYDKWLTPYYKQVLKIEPPVKEQWLTGQYEGKSFHEKAIEFGTKLDQEVLGHALKTSASTTQGLLNNVADATEFISKLQGENEYSKKRVQSIRNLSNKFAVSSEAADRYLESVHNVGSGEKPKFRDDIPGNIASLGTSAVFFEATGAAKAAKILNVANPKTAALTYQMAKASWNGAVDYGMWSASQGEKGSDIVESIGTGGVLGIAGKLGQRKAFDPLFGMLKTLFKFGGPEATKTVINATLEKALGEKFPTSRPLSAETQKFVDTASQKMNEYSLEKFKKPFEQLAYIQKQHVLNRMLAVNAEAAHAAHIEGMPKELIQAEAKEVDEMMLQIFPESKQAQESVDKFVKENGKEPVQTKLLASLPHHNTTIDSPNKHINARISFLRNQLANAKGEAERVDLRQALKEEQNLLEEKKVLLKKASGGTVGGAAANDTRVFKGDEYVVTPNVDPYRHGFSEWYEDSFAKNVAQQAKIQALAKGQKQSFIANAIDNSFHIGSNLSAATRKGEGITKQLFHPQYGLVGGINYEFRKAASLGENSGLKASEDVLYISYLGMRPNVVSRVWNIPGGGQTLFLNALEEANRKDIGVALIPFDESKSFYEKMGMKEAGSYMVMDKDKVKALLSEKGLLMMLLGAGITYGADKSLSDGHYSVRGSN